MSRPRPSEPLWHLRNVSAAYMAGALSLPGAANDLYFEPQPSRPEQGRTGADHNFRARFWRAALPALGLFWTGVTIWVLS